MWLLGAGQTGSSISAVRSAIAHSGEAAGDVAQLFQTAISRAASNAEIVGMEDLLGNGATQATLQGTLSSSGAAGVNTIVTVPTGSTSLTAQPNTPTTFVFGDIAFGNDTIAGFDPTRDAIQLPKALVGDVTTLLGETTSSAAGTLITLNPTQSVQINGIAKSALGASNFVIL
jgi:hypothetical protein